MSPAAICVFSILVLWVSVVLAELSSNTIVDPDRDDLPAFAYGCWIVQDSCARHGVLYEGAFLDNFEDSSLNEQRCFQRAMDFHLWCRNAVATETVAYFGSTGRSRTFPVSVTGCFIVQNECVVHGSSFAGVFEDDFDGASSDSHRCVHRAIEYHYWCRNPSTVTTRAVFADTGASLVFPYDQDPLHEEVDNLQQLALAFRQAGNLRESSSNFLHILELAPTHATSMFNLGVVLFELEMYDNAVAAFYDAAQYDIKYASGVVQVYIHTGRFEEAAAIAEPILRQGQADASLLTAYARLARRLGQVDETVALLEQTLGSGALGANDDPELKPLMIFALGRLLDESGRDQLSSLEEIEAQQLISPHESQRRHQLAELSFDRAFHAYARGNALVARQVDVDVLEAMIARLDLLRLIYSRGRVAKLGRGPRTGEAGGKHAAMPVFIIGMPRSGTSLVEQILGVHPQLHAGGELNGVLNIAKLIDDEIGATTVGALAEGLERLLTPSVSRHYASLYLQYVSGFAHTATRVTSKLPFDFERLGLMHVLFPEARFIHVTRDPRDAGLSTFFQYFRVHGETQYSYDLHDTGRYFGAYQRLMAHWRDEVGVPMLEVAYEELVTNQEAVTRRMVAHLGLAWDDACLAPEESERVVATCSNEQVREPVYTSSVGRWRRYVKHLGPFVDGLEGRARSVPRGQSEYEVRAALEDEGGEDVKQIHAKLKFPRKATMSL